MRGSGGERQCRQGMEKVWCRLWSRRPQATIERPYGADVLARETYGSHMRNTKAFSNASKGSTDACSDTPHVAPLCVSVSSVARAAPAQAQSPNGKRDGGTENCVA